jgi:hypothetical protein
MLDTSFAQTLRIFATNGNLVIEDNPWPTRAAKSTGMDPQMRRISSEIPYHFMPST